MEIFQKIQESQSLREAKIPIRHLNNNLSKNKTNIDTAE